MTRPQYPKTCGMSSVMSCWNYLFSTLGAGALTPVSTEEALHTIGFLPPFGGIKFGGFTGNIALTEWFQVICKKFGVKGSARVVYKRNGDQATNDISDLQAMQIIKKGLKSENKAYIYHC